MCIRFFTYCEKELVELKVSLAFWADEALTPFLKILLEQQAIISNTQFQFQELYEHPSPAQMQRLERRDDFDMNNTQI